MKYSGKFVIRTSSELHQKLKQDALRQKISLNEYCNLLLQQNLLGHEKSRLSALAEFTRSFLKENLLGILLHGSWVRNEFSTESDIDVLVVASDDVPITRELYSKWDDSFDDIKFDLPIEVQFIHLPVLKSRISSLWAEVAMESIILAESEFCLSRHLNEIRRSIREGKLKRKLSHGQPYWVFESEVTLA